MPTATLPARVGIAFGQDLFHMAVTPERSGLRHRAYSGKFGPTDTVASIIEKQVLPRLCEEPPYIGVSHPDHDLITAIGSVKGIPLVPVFPTAATLAGLQVPGFVDVRNFELQPATVPGDGKEAILKIGYMRATFATTGELEPTGIYSREIETFGRGARVLLSFIRRTSGNRNPDPLELLGNLGWVNAAKFLLTQGWLPKPDELTLQMLAEATSRAAIRKFVFRIGALTKIGDLFATRLSRFMAAELYGPVIRYAVRRTNPSRLYVQSNAISACDSPGCQDDSLAKWLLNNGLRQFLPAGVAIVLNGPLPGPAEALGATVIAQRLIDEGFEIELAGLSERELTQASV